MVKPPELGLFCEILDKYFFYYVKSFEKITPPGYTALTEINAPP
jgi:hypothetical protein